MSAELDRKRALRKSTILLTASAATVFAVIVPHHHFTLQQIGSLLLVPAAAAAAMYLIADVVPSLFPNATSFLPGCLTLPLVHTSLVVALASLTTTTAVGIQQPPETSAAVLHWLQPRHLTIAAFVQGVALAVDALALRISERRRQAPAE